MRRIVAVLALLAASPVAPATSAEHVPWAGRASLSMTDVRAPTVGTVSSGWRREYALRNDGCVVGRRATVRGRVMTIVGESGCDGLRGSMTFDPVSWRASVVGTIPTWSWREIRHLRRGRWRLVSSTSVRSTATVDLRWLGRDAPRVHHSYWIGNPLGCYWPPGCVGGASAWLSREATVEGTIRFAGLGATVRLPARHRGSMTMSG